MELANVVLVDASVWLDYLEQVDTPETAWLDRELDRQRLGLLDVTLADVLRRATTDVQADSLERALLKFQLFVAGGVDFAIMMGIYERTLRQRGVALRKTNTASVATFCLMNDLALLHSDRDFDPFERYLGLGVVQASGAGSRS